MLSSYLTAFWQKILPPINGLLPVIVSLQGRWDTQTTKQSGGSLHNLKISLLCLDAPLLSLMRFGRPNTWGRQGAEAHTSDLQQLSMSSSSSPQSARGIDEEIKIAVGGVRYLLIPNQEVVLYHLAPKMSR
jgi:hypothetical protein